MKKSEIQLFNLSKELGSIKLESEEKRTKKQKKVINQLLEEKYSEIKKEILKVKRGKGFIKFVEKESPKSVYNRLLMIEGMGFTCDTLCYAKLERFGETEFLKAVLKEAQEYGIDWGDL